MSRRRRFKQGLAALLVGAAAWHGGQGLYIYSKAALAQHLIAQAWEQTQKTHTPQKPWPWADTWPVARLRLPHSKDLYVLAGTSGNALAFGPGHESASALPGQSGVSVIGGHRDTHFRALKYLQLNDVIDVQRSDRQWQRYRVDVIQIVDSRTTPLQIPAPSPQASVGKHSQLLLITCYPFDTLQTGGPLRYLVTASALASQA